MVRDDSKVSKITRLNKGWSFINEGIVKPWVVSNINIVATINNLYMIILKNINLRGIIL